jgi:hypothetical protein
VPHTCSVPVAVIATEIIKEYETLLGSRNKDHSHLRVVKRVFDVVQKLPVLLRRAHKVEIKFELQKATGYIKCLKGGLGKDFSNSSNFQKALIRK